MDVVFFFLHLKYLSFLRSHVMHEKIFHLSKMLYDKNSLAPFKHFYIHNQKNITKQFVFKFLVYGL